ncbi:retrotransposon protein, putative, ty1-copia subclass [Tanacetum coccineum]
MRHILLASPRILLHPRRRILRRTRSATNAVKGSRKLKLGASSLYLGNGHRAAVKAIGEFHLCLTSGLVLILHNCHYTSSITRGIILVLCLYKDGFINRFENDNSISVSKNNLVYFCAIPRDDIYEIDLSSFNTNDSSMYAISNKRAKLNLDSTLLWHWCLGHISKKRIKKLQHDGLLNSTNIKSFEKYVSCMSGKMARKPYSHQVERAKYLLGLIHTNVCGPFRTVSRQGASYFVTFTDDFSHYGYVYLLKHKHEVFGTFKVFQKEVENQLGKTIKSLRSDRGGYPKETMRYYFYYPLENKIFVAPNAEFYENSLITQEASGKIDEPQCDINPIRKSTKTCRAPDRMCLHVDAEEHELGDLGEPANYKAALLDPKSDKWLNAMNVEMQSKKDNNVWDLVDLPPDGKIVGSKWLLKKKTDMDDATWIYPNARKAKLSKLQGASTRAEKQHMQNVPYASAVGSVMLGIVPTIEEPIKMYCDNTRAIVIAKESGITKGARHYRAKVYYLREVIEYGDVKIEKVHTYDNLADPFTKALPYPKHSELTKNIGLILASSLM